MRYRRALKNTVADQVAGNSRRQLPRSLKSSVVRLVGLTPFSTRCWKTPPAFAMRGLGRLFRYDGEFFHRVASTGTPSALLNSSGSAGLSSWKARAIGKPVLAKSWPQRRQCMSPTGGKMEVRPRPRRQAGRSAFYRRRSNAQGRPPCRRDRNLSPRGSSVF